MRIARTPRIVFAALLCAVSLTASSAAPDIYDAAVAHTGRSADDIKRDPNDYPASVLRFAGIQPGMQVLDFFAADGYYSELASYVVGDKGHVLLLNNDPYDKFASNAWKPRIENHHLANVEHVTVDPAHMSLKDNSLDAILMIKVYHDMYWVDPKNGWPKIDVGLVLDQLSRALKPGGKLVIVDHSAKPGSGTSAAGPLHRIDEAYMRKDFESHGFAFVAKNDIMRRPDDKMDQISYKGPMVNKTDRFVYLFQKK
jgi:predicted methyltransferase